jgi:hypothetical protein
MWIYKIDFSAWDCGMWIYKIDFSALSLRTFSMMPRAAAAFPSWGYIISADCWRTVHPCLPLPIQAPIPIAA